MKKKEISHRLDGLLALLIFGVFAVCVLAVLLTGARAYKRLTVRDREAYDQRTVLQYVATRVWQSDRSDAVTVTNFDGVECLTLTDVGEETTYVTQVYYYDGYVRELYAEAEAGLDPDAGEQIIEAEGLSFALDDGLLTVTARTNGGEESLTLSLRSKEVAP